MEKEHILREIQRTAKANGGAALGWRRFEDETGIRYYEKVFRRLGPKPQLAARILAYCESNPDYADVAALWGQVSTTDRTPKIEDAEDAPTAVGYVYMLKHGTRREYKIGRTNNPLRREGELGIQLPEKLQPVHTLKTDDPAGVEAYWHSRFGGKRKEGEWFELTAQDVRAFKRWRSIY